jgi:adenylate cyclase
MSETEKDETARSEAQPMHGVLRAVLVADAAGYSRLMPEDPTGTIVSLNRHRARMREIVSRNNGSEAGFPGDYLLALFAAAGDALETALEFLHQQEEDGGRVPLQFRVGLHVGDVFEQAGDVLGVAINVASRLQQSAPVGGIVMSQTFRQSLPGKLRVPATDIGELRLKNVDEPVRAFEVRMPGGPEGPQGKVADGGAEPVDEQAPALPDTTDEAHEKRPRIYIRSFRALGKAERAVVFADGLVEELVTTLGLFTDVFRTVHAAESGERGGGYEITGQVRNGDRLRITCHLIDRASGDTLWGDRFDFGNDASYDAQERIAVAVVTALQLNLTDGETAGLWSNRPTSLAAWEEFHRGRMCEARYTRESNTRAKGHFGKAIALDPDFVPAIVALGFSHLDAVRLGWTADHDGDIERAFALAGDALSKDADDPYAIALLAYAERAQGKREQSVATMARAVRIAPRNGELVAYFAHMLWVQGDLPAAISQNRRALELTPQPSSWIRANLGLALLWDGQTGEAQRIFEAVIGSDPDYARAYIGLVVALVRQSKMDEARTVYRALRVTDPGFEPETWIVQNRYFNPPKPEQFIADLMAAAQ